MSQASSVTRAIETPWRLGREELLQAIIDSATDYAIFVIDLDGRMVTWNSGGERLLGSDQWEIIGKPCAIFFTREDQAADLPAQLINQALEHGRSQDDRWHIRK